jgi:hypothetical protein
MDFYFVAFRTTADQPIEPIDCNIDVEMTRFFRSIDFELTKRVGKLYYAKGGTATGFAFHAVRIEAEDLASIAAGPATPDIEQFVDNARRLLADGEKVIVHIWW